MSGFEHLTEVVPYFLIHDPVVFYSETVDKPDAGKFLAIGPDARQGAKALNDRFGVNVIRNVETVRLFGDGPASRLRPDNQLAQRVHHATARNLHRKVGRQERLRCLQVAGFHRSQKSAQEIFWCSGYHC